MVFNFLIILLPLLATDIFAYMYFEEYYSSSPFLLGIVLFTACCLSLFFTLPRLDMKRKPLGLFFIFIPYLALYVMMYNFMFFLSGLLAAFLITLFLPKKREYKKILFTDNNELFCINYIIKKSKKELFGRMGNIFALFVVILYISGFIFTTPTPVWLFRAFPVDISEKEVPEGEVSPWGIMTTAYWYDQKALFVSSFYETLTSDSALVCPAFDAGIRQGDFVIKINSTPAIDSKFIKNGASDAAPITITVARRNEDMRIDIIDFTVTPVYSEENGKYVVGMMYYPLEDVHFSSQAALSTSVQTLSFVYPDTRLFAATAHSSSDIYSDMDSLSAHITSSFVYGRSEDGILSAPFEYIGDIQYTNKYGAFGTLLTAPTKTIPLGRKTDLRVGKATLITTLDGVEPKEYDIYITGTYRIGGRDVFCLIATDERLIDEGGITYGMSGSPIVQNGKLIGALSNTDKGGYNGYATFAYDMAHELTKAS